MRSFSANRSTPGVAWLVVFALACGGSVALALVLALGHSVGAWTWPPVATLDYSAWRAVLAGKQFWLALGYSLRLTAVTVLLALGIALTLLMALGARLHGALLGRVLFLPLAVPGVVAALMAYSVLGDSGYLSRVAFSLGWVTTPAEFPTLIFDPSGRGIVLTHVAMITPLFVLLFDRLAAQARLATLFEQAATLGATRSQRWLRIGIPLLLHQARAVIAVYGVVLLGAYEVPLLIGAAQPAMISVTIQRAIGGYDLSQRPLGYAMASLYLIVLLSAWMVLAWRPARQAQ